MSTSTCFKRKKKPLKILKTEQRLGGDSNPVPLGLESVALTTRPKRSARSGFEPRTPGCAVRRSIHSATRARKNRAKKHLAGMSEGLSGKYLCDIAAQHECTRSYFRGVKAANMLPHHIERYPAFYIVNSSLWWESGEHWLLIFGAAADQPLIFFDSLGKRPRQHSPFIERFLTLNSSPFYVSNIRRWQPPTSKLCGLYCLFVGHELCRGQTLASTLSRFDPINLTANDELVKDFSRKRLSAKGL